MGGLEAVKTSDVFPSLGIVKWVAGSVVLVALILIVFGNLSSHQRKAQRIAETRGLQQWGIALNLYLIENENQLPEVGTAPVESGQKRAWFNALPPFISEQPLGDLPVGERPRPGVPSIWIRPGTKPVKIWDSEAFYFNYGMNTFLQPTEGARSFRIYEIGFPGNVIFLAPTAGFVPGSSPELLAVPKGRQAEVPILFCDGHVQAVPAAALLDPSALAAPTGGSGVSWFQR